MELFGQVGNGPNKEYMCGIYVEFRRVVQEKILFKIFLSTALAGILFSEAEEFRL